MNDFQLKGLSNYFNKIVRLLLVIFLFLITLSIFEQKNKSGYSLFIEFNNAYGIKPGTSINFRGVQIGSIKKIYIKINSVIILANIKSDKILIPKASIVETNQTGLFNDTVVDIIPLRLMENNLSDLNNKIINVFSKQCLKSNFLCNYHYLQGNRGLNYDDLVRAATRISQRFDDPRFFSFIYLFLQNSVEISDDLLNMIKITSNIFSLFVYFFEIYILKHFI
uniref:Mce/MlaD domain-containing protein n=1 Tax=Dipterocladia arabiensis TaxID=2007176 RepID=A0A1Z1M056_9FLOR|nr:hypothetical protein [Dipterocladia arabiensis]ARW59339.1 hypothetical protein [Dipterocladia arabiensis]